MDPSLALWKHHVKLLLQSFWSVSLFSTDEDPSLQIESFAAINLSCVSTKLNGYCISHANVQGTY